MNKPINQLTNQQFNISTNQQDFKKRAVLFLFAFLVLIAVYVFQRFSYIHMFFGVENDLHPYTIFVFNKSVRLILNDTACLFIIYALFYDIKYVRIGGFVQLLEMFFILPLYFVIKLSLEGDSEISSPLLSQLHRLIVNPTLMVLLMIGFYYQNKKKTH